MLGSVGLQTVRPNKQLQNAKSIGGFEQVADASQERCKLPDGIEQFMLSDIGTKGPQHNLDQLSFHESRQALLDTTRCRVQRRSDEVAVESSRVHTTV